MAQWNLLPNEMKVNVFKYLNDLHRVNFAQSSLDFFKQVMYLWTDRKVLRIIKLNNDCIELDIDGRIARFEQNCLLCRLTYDNKIVWEGIGNSENMAYHFFATILSNSSNSLQLLTVYNVSVCFDDLKIDDFPKLETLRIITDDRGQLYWFSLRSKNICNLCVKFTESAKPGNINQVRLPVGFKWLSITYIELISNVTDVAFDIINASGTHRKETLIVNFNMDDKCIPQLNQQQLTMFKSFTRYLELNLVLTNDQFVQLASSTYHLHFDGRQIDPSIILHFMKTTVRKQRKKVTFRNFQRYQELKDIFQLKNSSLSFLEDVTSSLIQDLIVDLDPDVHNITIIIPSNFASHNQLGFEDF